jgi:hypothetical protein
MVQRISITNPQGECFDIDYFGLITKTIGE